MASPSDRIYFGILQKIFFLDETTERKSVASSGYEIQIQIRIEIGKKMWAEKITVVVVLILQSLQTSRKYTKDRMIALEFCFYQIFFRTFCDWLVLRGKDGLEVTSAVFSDEDFRAKVFPFGQNSIDK